MNVSEILIYVSIALFVLACILSVFVNYWNETGDKSVRGLVSLILMLIVIPASVICFFAGIISALP